MPAMHVLNSIAELHLFHKLYNLTSFYEINNEWKVQ